MTAHGAAILQDWNHREETTNIVTGWKMRWCGGDINSLIHLQCLPLLPWPARINFPGSRIDRFGSERSPEDESKVADQLLIVRPSRNEIHVHEMLENTKGCTAQQ